MGGCEIMVEKKPIRVSENFYGFIDRGLTNRVKSDTDKKTISINEFCDTIYKYFKENNKRYLEVMKIQVYKK